MISDFFIGMALSVSQWVAGMFPTWDPPAWMTDAPARISSVMADYTGLGVWVDWTALSVVVSAVISTYVIGSTIRLVRAVIAHVPEFGGGG